MDPAIAAMLERSIARVSGTPQRMPSGGGHDAMVLARCMPAGMIFLRCANGISHHPDESVEEADVALAIEAATRFVTALARAEVPA